MSETKKLAYLYIAKVRRSLRRAAAARDALLDERRLVERRMRLLIHRGNPFDRARISSLRVTATALEAAAEHHEETMRRFGGLLLRAAHLIDAALDLAERCDALNVNVADRAGLDESHGFTRLVFVDGLEDSAEHRDKEWKSGTFFDALHAAYCEWLDTPDGERAMSGAFGPGGVLDGFLIPDGVSTSTRPGPRLLH
ncbi:hypothetical protein [Burkholderia sp. BCC1993]|uniref:hypothetical protein n=1 Tax=Burkholderia sp. BCC1993 TaxID=2817444 RepID=UPI002AB13CDE|nr:hypothetical protein [Burkholderia sp. BCC1993]